MRREVLRAGLHSSSGAKRANRDTVREIRTSKLITAVGLVAWSRAVSVIPQVPALTPSPEAWTPGSPKQELAYQLSVSGETQNKELASEARPGHLGTRSDGD